MHCDTSSFINLKQQTEKSMGKGDGSLTRTQSNESACIPSAMTPGQPVKTRSSGEIIPLTRPGQPQEPRGKNPVGKVRTPKTFQVICILSLEHFLTRIAFRKDRTAQTCYSFTAGSIHTQRTPCAQPKNTPAFHLLHKAKLSLRK